MQNPKGPAAAAPQEPVSTESKLVPEPPLTSTQKDAAKLAGLEYATRMVHCGADPFLSIGLHILSESRMNEESKK